ncbi:MAG: hypothetical protein P1U70_26020 [Saprospiraceae bacterium]|nr:hypothetical protein [Saprospiraceae bacterium]
MVAEVPTTIDTIDEVLKPNETHVFSQDEFIKLGCHRIPYKTNLSFVPMINWWRQRLDSKSIAERILAKEIISRVEEAPELMDIISDDSLLEKHQDIIDLLMSGLFPLSIRDKQFAKASPPFIMKEVFKTPTMEKMMTHLKVSYKIGGSMEMINASMLVQACSIILNKVYGQNIKIDPGFILTMECPTSLMKQHYRSILYSDFLEVKTLNKPKKLSQEKINQLLGNIHDLNAWTEAIPPENFEINGIIGIEFIDVSEREILSSLKNELLQKDAVVKPENIKTLQQMLRSFFQLSELRMGITAIDYPRERAIQHKYKIRFDFLAEQQEMLLAPENTNSLYEKACRYKEIVMIEDLEKIKFKTPIERDLLASGIRCIMIAPLMNSNKDVIGLFEIGSPKPYGMNAFAELKFEELIPLFSLAVERSRKEIDNQIEAIIRERFTTIHPSVEWKFIECAYQKEEKTDKRATPTPILFENVHPLYGQADIVSSSTTRNRAIQSDFIENLNKIKKVLKISLTKIDFPILHHYLLETEHLLEELKEELKSNDENRIMDFIKNEVHEVLQEIAQKDSEITFAVTKYFSELDNEYGVVYNERKKYEDSVAMINETLSDFIEKEDLRTQKMIPHYFEKYKTDGVEYEIYAGQSLLRNQKFSPIHLKNLRLTQLITMCHVTQKMDTLRTEMPVPLSTAQLIFVYSNPISVRFRMDDKHFDVDGAYNIRYEIIKKRIDKAYIDGTTERLTQKGKIAIVYTTDKDKNEYLEYINYLTREGLIDDNIEDLTLGKLQGVQGLRALRITVKV